MTQRAHYSAAEARTLRDEAQRCLDAWPQRRTREFKCEVGSNHQELVVTAWHKDTPGQTVTFRVPYDRLFFHRASAVLDFARREFPLRPVPGRR